MTNLQVSTFIGDQLLHYLRQDNGTDAHTEEGSTCTGGCLTTWKIVFAAILFIEALIFGHVVVLVSRQTMKAKSKRLFANIVHFGNAVAAGIFLSTALLHIFPECIELFNGVSHADEGEDAHSDRSEDAHAGHSVKFPWPFFTLLVGFYAFFALEKLILPIILPGDSAHLEHIDADGKHSHTHDEEENLNNDDATDTTASNSKVDASPKETKFFSRSFLIALVQVFGISVHSLFESMTIGSSGRFNTVFNIFIAVLAHRWATAAAVAFSLTSNLSYFQFLTVFLVFSIMCPLGVAIGFATSGMNTTVQGVLFGISASTLFYIGAFELMSEEYVEHKKWLGWKFLGTASGVAIMSIITAILVALNIHG